MSLRFINSRFIIIILFSTVSAELSGKIYGTPFRSHDLPLRSKAGFKEEVRDPTEGLSLQPLIFFFISMIVN